MKFFKTLLASTASATSLEGHLRSALLPEETGLANIPINNGLCQAYDGFTFFNLKTFQPGLASNSKVPLHQDTRKEYGDSYFIFNLCAIQGVPKTKTLLENWNAHSGKPVVTEGASSKVSNALWEDGTTVKHYFTKGAMFDGMEDPKTGKNIGFHLNWVSDEMSCKSKTVGAKPKESFKVTLNAKCSQSKTVTSEMTSSNCQAIWNYEGPEACGVTIPIEKYMSKIEGFMGIIAIVIGFIMTFQGSRFIQLLGAVVVGLFVSLIVVVIGYNVLPSTSSMGILIVLLIVGIALGALAGKLGWNFIKLWAVSIMAAAAACAGILVLCGAFNIDNKYAKVGLVFVAILGGGFLGKKLNKPIKTFGTAFVGAFLVVRGFSTIFGGWPGDHEIHHLHHSKKILAYLGAFIALFIGGALVQLRLIRDEDVKEGDEDDAFQGQDEGRTCGCF